MNANLRGVCVYLCVPALIVSSQLLRIWHGLKALRLRCCCLCCCRLRLLPLRLWHITYTQIDQCNWCKCTLLQQQQHEHKQGTALGAAFASCRTFVLRKLHLIDLIGASRSKETKDFSDAVVDGDGEGDVEDFFSS